MEKQREELLALVAPVMQKLAFELIDLELKGSKHNLIVRIIADTAGGISIDDCATLSRALADVFDSQDAIPGKYRLEVSSPGIDRPLRSRRDFERNLGREAWIRRRQGESAAEIEGKIQAVTEAAVEIAAPEQSHLIPLAEIELGRIKVKW